LGGEGERGKKIGASMTGGGGPKKDKAKIWQNEPKKGPKKEKRRLRV